MASLLLRIGLAFTFLYVAIASFLEPVNWIGFFPFEPSAFVFQAFSVFELFLALWLLSGVKTFFAALISAVLLAGIVVTNLGAMDIVFRDAGLFFAALALAVLSK